MTKSETERFLELFSMHVSSFVTEREQTELWKLARKFGFKFVESSADLQHSDGRYLSYRRFN